MPQHRMYGAGTTYLRCCLSGLGRVGSCSDGDACTGSGSCTTSGGASALESPLGKGRKPRNTHSIACRRPNVALPAIPLMNNTPIRICPAVGAESADGAVVGMRVMKQPTPTAIEASHFANSHNLCHPFISNSYVVCLSKRSQVVCGCNVLLQGPFEKPLKNLCKPPRNPL